MKVTNLLSHSYSVRDCCEKRNKALSSPVVYFPSFKRSSPCEPRQAFTEHCEHQGSSSWRPIRTQWSLAVRVSPKGRWLPSGRRSLPLSPVLKQLAVCSRRKTVSISPLTLSLVVLFFFSVGAPELPGQWPEAGRPGTGLQRGSVLLLWNPTRMGFCGWLKLRLSKALIVLQGPKLSSWWNAS